MTILKQCKLRFITPAFCAGADQNEPEIREPSIRGALRWWFRVLGGTSEQEKAVFGGVHGGAVTSKLVIRVSEVKIINGREIVFNRMSDKGYLYYFAKESGKKEGIRRTESGHYIAENSECKVLFALRASLETDVQELLVQAIDAFLLLGALGLRATRGCGCFTADEPVSREELAEVAERLSDWIMIRVVDPETVWTSATKCQEALGGFLRALRKDNQLSGKRQSALGFSDGKGGRESSALKLRPVQTKDGFLPVVIYTDRACGQPSCREVVGRATFEIL